jgi:hypothetical protein
MTDEKRGGPPSRGGPGGGNRDSRPGGGRDGGGRGGPRKGGGFGKGPVKQARAETYESLRELARGEGFRIDKFVVAEKGTHKLVKTEYRLTREGLKDVHTFQRLIDAQPAATAPLPEPEPEIVEEVVEATAEAGEESAEAATEMEHVEAAEVAEGETVKSEPAESESSVEHVATEESAS